MQRLTLWLITILGAALAGGGAWYYENHLSEDQIAQQVKSSLQTELNGADFREFHIQVQKIAVLHDSGNHYEAMATVADESGATHEVPVHVLVDGRKLAWNTDNGAFAFALQASLQKAATDLMKQADTLTPQVKQPITRPAEVDEESLMPPDVKTLADQWLNLNETCRGGSGDNPATLAACDKREAVYAQIHDANWCWGHKDDDGASRTWVRCAPGDS